MSEEPGTGAGKGTASEEKREEEREENPAPAKPKGKGKGGADRSMAQRGRAGLSRVPKLLARLVALIGTVVALIIIAGILLFVLEANRRNGIVQAVNDATRWLVGPFDGLFDLKKRKVENAVNWGIAAAVWFVLAGIVARALRRI
jgi:hypothetical protein